MKQPTMILLATLSILWLPPATAQAQVIIDQSFISPHNLAANINSCCRYVAQTFTAGITGYLVGVNINVNGFTDNPLRVAIRTASGDGPSPTVLTETVLASSSSPLSNLVLFPSLVELTAGARYAIVVDYPTAPPPPSVQGVWSGATGNAYPAGGLFFSFSDGLSWFESVGGDVHFQTHMVPRTVFSDGFESGDTSAWSYTVGFDDHGNDAVSSTPIGVPSVTPGVIEVGGDEDWFNFSATAGSNYVFETSLGSLPDSTLGLYATNGITLLDFDDDGGPGLASRIEWTAPASGTYYLEVEAYGGTQTGSYTLSVTIVP